MRKLKRSLSLILTFLLILSQGTLVSFASEGSAELLGITVGNLSITDFDPAVTEYEVEIPYKYIENDFETVVVPEIKAYAVSPDAMVNITQSDDIDTAAEIEVINGENTNVYTVTFTKTGLNMFEDGGFETSAPFDYYRTIGFASSAVTESPKAGQQALTHSNTVWNPLWVNPADIVAKAGTTYLVTYFTRDPENSEKNWYGGNKGRYSASTFYKEDGSTRNGDSLGKLSTSWSRVIQTYVPQNDLSGSSMAYGPITMTAAVPIEIDEMYIAPLDVTDIIYTGDRSVVVPVEGAESITLSAELRNQIGGTHGLENLSADYSLVEDYQGVSLEGDVLTVDSSAVNVTALVRIDVTHTLHGEEKTVSNLVPIEIKVPEPSEAELLSIRLGGLSIPDFNPLIKEYSFSVPYRYITGDFETIEVPQVTYVKRNKDAVVNVSYPDSVYGEQITIDVSCGDDSETYTIALSPVGLNVYDDGGFETDAWVNANNYRTEGIDGASVRLSDKMPKGGSYALSYTIPKEKMLYAPLTPKLTVGITYLHSVFVRQPGGEAIRLYNTASGSDVRKHYDESGNIQSTDEVTGVIEEWKQLVSTHLANAENDFMTSPIHYKDNMTVTAELDDNFLAPMVITGITYTGDTPDITIPEDGGENVSIPLRAKMQNAIGGTQGLEGSKIVFGFAEDYPGVSIKDNNKLIVTENAVDGPIIITMTADTDFESVQGEIVNTVEGYLHTASQSASVPKVRNFTADRLREAPGYVVEGSYLYYQALGEAEGDSIINWQHSSLESGGFADISGADAITYDVADEYKNSYLRLSVTPVTESGTEGITYYSNVISPPHVPKASDVHIEGVCAVGEVLKGCYSYSDVNNDEENGTEYIWAISDKPEGPFTAVSGAVTDTYEIKEADINKYIIFKVIPKNLTDPPVGTTEATSPVLCAAYPVLKNVAIEKMSTNVYAVSYEYSHGCNITEGATKIEWFADGNLVKTGNNVNLTNLPYNLSVKVTPVASKAPFEGTPVTMTTAIKTVSAGQITRPSGGGGGGGFGGGGAGVIVPVPEVKPQETPVEEAKPVKHWAADGIDFCKQNGIMQDYAKDDFGNAQIVTRAELVSYIIKAIGVKETEYKHGFKDVSVRDYYSGALQTAVDMGIISEADNFEPMRNVSRQEVCKILVTAFGTDIGETSDLTKFTDIDSIGGWARDYVSKAVSKGLLKGVSETSFDPLGFVTREQTAVILHRLCNLRNGGSVE